MKRSIATAAACGISLFGFPAVAGAAGNPPNPNPAAINAGTATACVAVIANNPTVAGTGVPGALNIPNQFDSGQVGQVFCGV